MTINVHIERVTLEGLELSPAEQRRFRADLESELAQRLASGGLRPGLARSEHVDSLATDDAPFTRGAALGREVAASVYSGLGEGDR